MSYYTAIHYKNGENKLHDGVIDFPENGKMRVVFKHEKLLKN